MNMSIDDGSGRGRGKGRGGGAKKGVCKFYLQGTCHRGNQCNFKHPKSQGGGRGKNTSPFGNSTSPFSATTTNNGPFGTTNSNTMFTNDNNQNKNKDKICINYQKTGHCKFGKKCHFSHDVGGTSPFGGQLTSPSPFGGGSNNNTSPFAGSPFAQTTATSPFGNTTTTAFNSSSSSPFLQSATTPSTPFGTPTTSSPFDTQPQQPPLFDKVAKDFVEYYFSKFCSNSRADIRTLLRDETCLRLNETNISGPDNIIKILMELGEAKECNIANIDAQPTLSDAGVLVLIHGKMQIRNGTFAFVHVFTLLRVPGGSANQYFICNMMQRWG